MTEHTSHVPGTFCWSELATTDQGEAKTFYTSVFGWTFNDFEMGPGNLYTMMQKEGGDVAAVYSMRPEQRAQNVPSHWMPYVAVTSADDAAKKATELGGTVLAEAFDVYDVGRMAVIQDPTGAVFCVWEPKRHIGARRLDEPGALCWTELFTADTDKAGEFYRALFGWEGSEQAMGPVMYTVFTNDGKPAGGMMKAPPRDRVPPHWTPFFAVDDCDSTVAQITGMGGSVLVPPTDSPYGRFAAVRDPQGALFAVIKQTVPAS